MLPDSKETELGSSDQEASPSARKNTGVVSVFGFSFSFILFMKRGGGGGRGEGEGSQF